MLLNLLELINRKMDALYFHLIRNQFTRLGKDVYIGRLSQLVGPECISIANGVSIGRGTYLCAWTHYGKQTFSPQIEFEENVIIGPYAHITAINGIEIGANTLLGKWITITDNSHGTFHDNEPPLLRPLCSKGKVKIGKNVWIGDKVTILPNVTIGDGAIIGANAVVAKDIPPHTVAVGNPVKIVKTLYNE